MNTTKHDRHGAVAGQVDCRVRPLVDRLRAAALPGTNRRVLDEEAAAEIELLREMLEAAERRRQAAQPAAEPVAHQYLFHSPFGGEVWHDSPRERNGSKPHGHRALYAHPAPAAQPAAEPDERAAFEVWALSDDGGWWPEAVRRVGEGYHAGAVTKQWKGWQARAMKAKP